MVSHTLKIQDIQESRLECVKAVQHLDYSTSAMPFIFSSFCYRLWKSFTPKQPWNPCPQNPHVLSRWWCSVSCRLLETDSKSLRSVNGSRRNSGSSLVSSSSASSNLSHLEEDSWILWGRIVNEWDDVRKKKEKQLKVKPQRFHFINCVCF